MHEFDETVKTLSLSEKEFTKYNELVNNFLLRQFFCIFSVMLVSILMFKTGDKFDTMLLYGMFGISAVSMYNCMAAFINECIKKRLMSKIFPTEIFGAMIFAALVAFASIHLLICEAFEAGTLQIVAAIINSIILITLLFMPLARPKRVAQKTLKLIEE